MNILDKIIADKYKSVEQSKGIRTIDELQQTVMFSRDCFSLKDSIKTKSGIIAEYKRKSPSKGIINTQSTINDVVQDYSIAGVSAISILTDNLYFGGHNVDINETRDLINIPILRKDFIIDSYQIYEAKSIGADAILLIASVLDNKTILEFSLLAKNLNLEILLEIHKEAELSSINQYVDCVGINNRNLKDFKVDINNSIALSKKIPSDFVKISESGISTISTINKLKSHGFEGFLIGENFMKTNDPGKACKEFTNQLSKSTQDV